MATAIFPPSSTTCPRASSRASRPATRTADGPMSTPRRVCPRSSGTPRILIFFETMLSAADLGGASGLVGVTTVVGSGVIEAFCSATRSRRNARQRPGKRNCLAHMLETANPGHGPLDSHAKAGMRHPAVLAEIQIPLESIFRQLMVTDALQQQVVIADALRATDDLAI